MKKYVTSLLKMDSKIIKIFQKILKFFKYRVFTKIKSKIRTFSYMGRKMSYCIKFNRHQLIPHPPNYQATNFTPKI